MFGNPLRGRVLASLVGVGALVTTVLGAPVAAQTTAPSVLDCGTDSSRILYWPNGHGKVRSQGFPAFPTPHIELYSGTGKTYAEADYLAYVDATGATDHAASCTPGTLTATSGGAIPEASRKVTTKAVALQCTAPDSSVLLVPNAQGNGVLSVIVTGASVAAASVGPNGPKLEYDSSKCKAGKPPK